MVFGVPWNADGAEDIVVAWLKSPGNYWRWKQGPRPELTREIEKLLVGAGIRRSHHAIERKIYRMVYRYSEVCSLLAARGVCGDAVVRGEVDRGIRTQVRAKCVRFCELWPTLREAPGRPSERRYPTQTAVALVHESLDESTSSGCVTYQSVSSSVFAQGERLVQASSYDRDSTTLSTEAYSQLDPELQREVAVNRVASERKMSDVYLEAEQIKKGHEIDERKWRAERERVGLEAHRRQADMELSAKTLLLRLQMEDEGVESALIDQAFPLPRP